MRTIFILLLGASISIGGPELPPGISLPSVSERCSMLAVVLDKFSNRDRNGGEFTPIVIVDSHNRRYACTWVSAPGRSDGKRSYEELVEIARKHVRQNLPVDVIGDGELLGSHKFFNFDGSDRVVWLFEYAINPSPMIVGPGLIPTLVVPVADDGAVLLSIREKKGG